MGIVLQEALRRLCVEIGWSYAVFWRAIGGPDRNNFGWKACRHLVWEDGYCEQTCGLESVCSAMLHQVHALGDGIVGKAALTGKHEWVLGNIINVNGSVMKGSTEMNRQYLAGIQTLAIIPVLPHGVVQLGSTQMVMESIGFINHVKTLFEQLGCIPGALSDITLKASSQQIQAHALLGMQSFFNQLQDVGTDMNSLLDVGCDSSDHLFGYPDSKSVTRPSSSIPRQSNGASESGRLVDQVIFSSPDGRLFKKISADDSSSGSHFQPYLGLSSTNLTFLERQLLSLPSIGVRESANDSKDASCKIKMLQLGAHGDTSSVSLKHFDTNSLPARNELLTSTNDIGRCSAHQGRESQCAVASSVEMPQVLQQTNNCDSSQKASEPSYPTTIDNSSETILSVGNQRKDSFLVQTLDGTHAGFYEHGSCYRSLLGELQDSEVHEKYDSLHALNEKSIVSPVRSTTGHDLFDVLGLDYKFGQRSLDDIVAHGNDACTFELNDDVSTCINQLDAGRNIDASNHELSCSGLFSEAGSDQLLDAVVSRVKAGAKPTMDDSVPCKTSLTKISSSSLLSSFPANSWVASLGQRHSEIFGLAPVIVKSETTGSSSVKSTCSMDRSEKAECHKSEVSLWAEKGQNMNCNSTLVAHCKRIDEAGKLNKKRSRPGENPRPRPKDRQMIQDRVKELREIVPNGAKCSIDALLEKTIKHMLFLQSVTKHADKLKETGQPKIITKEGGLLLKDNFEGGATWAFEVGSQSMTCPIVVEDLNPPRQMLVEMLCEERGLFLEIADLIRGLGLTILKGVMEARNNKVWARFAVEANRDVTRMEIFLSLVRLLEPTAGSKKIPEVVDSSNKLHNVFHHPSTIPASGLSDCLW